MTKTLITFSIFGTHNGHEKNPVPKLKMTGKQHWTPKAQEYVKWKSFVASCLNSYVGKLEDRKLPEWYSLTGKKPIVLQKGQDAHMHLHITWANEAHGDPENIFGSIADALFENDKHLAGSFDFEHSKEKKSRVDVTIQIYGMG